MIQRFFIACSGTNMSLLDQCPPTEKTKFIGIGATIFFTALMAAVSGMFFISFAFTNNQSKQLEIGTSVIVAFGILWGLLIFNIDRNLIISLRKTGNWKTEVRQVWMRFVLAVFIGFVISTPLELKLFNNEVVRKMASDNSYEKDRKVTEKYAAQSTRIHSLDSILSVEQNNVNIKEQRKNELYGIYIAEAEGTGGTYKRGRGPVFNEKKHESDLADSLFMDEKKKLDRKKNEHDSLVAEINRVISEEGKSIDAGNGIGTRISALYHSASAHWFITFLFIIIEILPIFTKIMSKKGPYDFLLEAVEHKHYIDQQMKISEINDNANNDLEVMKFGNQKKKNNKMRLEEIRNEEELEQNKKLLRHVAEKQEILAKDAINKWFTEKQQSSSSGV